ncbi:MAG: nuclear transport factor 2 family protein [Baekduia sp.]
MAASFRVLALLVALPLVLGACGQAAKDSASDFQGDQKVVAQTVEDLQSAGRKNDSAKICSTLLSSVLVTQIEKASGEDCEKGVKDAISDADSFELQVEKVTISKDVAMVVVKSEGGDKDRVDTWELLKENGAWKVATLGA